MKPEREPFDIQEAWCYVGELYRCIVSLFGLPFELAMQLMLVRKERREILAWLGPAEALARRILMLRALTLPKPNEEPPRAAPGKLLIAFTDRQIADIHEDATKWNVVFNVMPRGALHRQPYKEKSEDQRSGGDFNALPLARRIEALRRVLENPAPAAARLARLLATQRDAIAAAFRPYRHPATCTRFVMTDVQRELDAGFNTS